MGEVYLGMSDKSPAERDYQDVVIPDEEEKPKPEWTVNERRAYILELWREAGDPYNIVQAEIAREFDLSHVQIHADYKVLKEYLNNNLDSGHESFIFQAMQTSMNKLLEQGEYDKASKAGMRLANFLQSMGKIEESPDEVKVEQSGTPSVSVNVSDAGVGSSAGDGSDDEEAGDK